MSRNGLDDRVSDTVGLTRFVLEGLDEVETEFLAFLVEEVCDRSKIRLDPPERALLARRLAETGVDIASGRVEETVLRLIGETTRESDWAPQLDRFLSKQDLDLPSGRRRAALHALDRLALKPQQSGNYEQTIARVLADLTAGSGTDPAALTAPPSRVNAWDFRVDRFDDTATQIVLSDNVRAAGALMWCYDIGERLGVYRLTDALVYRWWIGLVDFADPDLTAQLYRYHKLRDQRPAEEERFLLYRRILNLGGVGVGDRVVVNTEFPQLWRTLMEEVALYIDKSESSFRTEQVDRQGIEQAVQELQYNLTEQMAGMALTQVTEMYNQLTQTDRDSGVRGGLDLMGHPEVVAQLSSGRRRDVWSVIERLARDEFGLVPNVSALRNSAVDGAGVVDFLAEFRPGTTDEDAFVAFVRSSKRWILAQKVAGSGLLVEPSGAADPDDDPDRMLDDAERAGDEWDEPAGVDDEEWVG